MAEERRESKYARKFAMRRRMDEGRENPKPLPLSVDYTRNYVPVGHNSFDPKPMKHEDPRQISRFRRPFVTNA